MGPGDPRRAEPVPGVPAKNPHEGEDAEDRADGEGDEEEDGHGRPGEAGPGSALGDARGDEEVGDAKGGEADRQDDPRRPEQGAAEKSGALRAPADDDRPGNENEQEQGRGRDLQAGGDDERGPGYLDAFGHGLLLRYLR